MKIAIMQPYFFPYIGYFQLLKSVDKFIFYDDVNYIKGGWINRNRLFLAGAVRYMTIPLEDASSFKKINKISSKQDGKWKNKILSSMDQSYSKSAFYNPVRDLVENALDDSSESLAVFAKRSIKLVASYIGIDANFVESSAIYKNQEKNGIDRIIDICHIEKASEYWNLPGGRDIYCSDVFKQKNIDLKFVNASIENYQQNSNEFIPGLSVIDVLMHNEPFKVLQLLDVGSQL